VFRNHKVIYDLHEIMCAVEDNCKNILRVCSKHDVPRNLNCSEEGFWNFETPQGKENLIDDQRIE